MLYRFVAGAKVYLCANTVKPVVPRFGPFGSFWISHDHPALTFDSKCETTEGVFKEYHVRAYTNKVYLI